MSSDVSLLFGALSQKQRREFAALYHELQALYHWEESMRDRLEACVRSLPPESEVVMEVGKAPTLTPKGMAETLAAKAQFDALQQEAIEKAPKLQTLRERLERLFKPSKARDGLVGRIGVTELLVERLIAGPPVSPP
jgi:Lon protease-like protein